MSITRATILAAVKEQVIRTDKDDEINTRIQWIANDIADDFLDFRGLRELSSAVALTENQSYVDIATELANLYGSRIRSVSLIDSNDDGNNRDLREMDYEEYIKWLPDANNPSSDHYGDPEEYCHEGDYLYFKEVPDLTTYSVEINFGKVHPTISASVDIIYPADFEHCIVEGTLYLYYLSVERNNGLAEKHKILYEQLKEKKINAYKYAPNLYDHIKILW